MLLQLFFPTHLCIPFLHHSSQKHPEVILKLPSFLLVHMKHNAGLEAWNTHDTNHQKRLPWVSQKQTTFFIFLHHLMDFRRCRAAKLDSSILRRISNLGRGRGSLPRKHIPHHLRRPPRRRYFAADFFRSFRPLCCGVPRDPKRSSCTGSATRANELWICHCRSSALIHAHEFDPPDLTLVVWGDLGQNSKSTFDPSTSFLAENILSKIASALYHTIRFGSINHSIRGPIFARRNNDGV